MSKNSIASFESCLNVSESNDVVKKDNQEMIQRHYDGKSIRGKIATSNFVLGQKGLSLSDNSVIELSENYDAITKKTIGNTIQLIVRDASNFLAYCKKNEMDKTKFVLSKGQDAILLSARFELRESYPARFFHSRKFNEDAFEIVIDGKKFSINPRLYVDGLRLTYKK